jgi:hypothetical protein
MESIRKLLKEAKAGTAESNEKFKAALKAALESTNDMEETQLHTAASSIGNLEAVNTILELCKSARCEILEVQDENGMTPLHLAAYVGNVAVVDFLVNKGADVDQRTIDNVLWNELDDDEGSKAKVEEMIKEAVQKKYGLEEQKEDQKQGEAAQGQVAGRPAERTSAAQVHADSDSDSDNDVYYDVVEQGQEGAAQEAQEAQAAREAKAAQEEIARSGGQDLANITTQLREAQGVVEGLKRELSEKEAARVGMFESLTELRKSARAGGDAKQEAQLREAVKNSAEEKTALEQEKVALEERVNALSGVAAPDKKEMDALRVQVGELKKLETQIAAETQKSTALEGAATKSAAEKTALEQEKTVLEEQLAEAVKNSAAEKTALEQEKVALEKKSAEEIKELKTRDGEYAELLTKAKQRILAAESEKAKNLREFEAQASKYSVTLEAPLRNLQREKDDLQVERDDLQGKLGEVDQEVQRLTEENQGLQENIEEKVGERAGERIGLLNKQVEELSEQKKGSSERSKNTLGTVLVTILGVVIISMLAALGVVSALVAGAVGGGVAVLGGLSVAYLNRDEPVGVTREPAINRQAPEPTLTPEQQQQQQQEQQEQQEQSPLPSSPRANAADVRAGVANSSVGSEQDRRAQGAGDGGVGLGGSH